MRTRSTSCTLKQYVVIGLLVSAIFGGFVPSHAQAKAGDKTSAYTISSRLPASLELVILYFLAIANVQLGIGEQAKKVHRSEDEQLLLFSQMVELLRGGFTQPKKIYNGPRIETLEQYIALTRPLRPNTGTVEGDLAYFQAILSAGEIPVPYEIDPFEKSSPHFASAEVKIRAQRFEYNSNAHLVQTLQKSDSLIGFVGMGMLGWITSGLSSASDALKFVNQLGVVPDVINFATQFANLLPVHELNLSVGSRTLKPAPALTALLTPTKTGGKAPLDAVKPVGKIGAAKSALPEVPIDVDTAEALGGYSPNSLAAYMEESADRFRKMADHIGSMEGKLINYLVAIGDQPASIQLKMIRFFEGQVRSVVSEFSTLGDRIIKSPEVQTELKKDGVGDFFQLLAVLLAGYPPKVYADVKKEMIWAFLRAPTSADDLDAFAIFTNESGQAFKQTIQVIASYVPAALAKLEEIMARQRKNGKKLTKDQMLEIMAADPNGYLTRLENFEWDFTPAGKLNTVVKAYAPEENGRAKGVKVQTPNARRYIQMDRQIFKALAPELVEVVRKNPALSKFELSPEAMGKIIDTTVEHTDGERNIPATVANQKLGRVKLHKEYALDVGGQLIVVAFRTPEVWDAVDGSRVMVSDWIEGAVDIEEFKTFYPDELKAIGFQTIRLFHDGLIFDPMKEAKEVAEAAKKAKKAGTTKAADPEIPEVPPKKITGFANFDGHEGNGMMIPPVDTVAAKFPFLIEKNFEPTRKVKYVEVWLPDYGIAGSVALETVENLLLLTGGASGNDAPTIAEALWNLQTEEGRADHRPPPWYRPLKRAAYFARVKSQDLEVPNLEAISAKRLTKAELSEIIKAKCKDLHKRWKYYTTTQWIMYVLDRSNFIPEVMLIDRGLKSTNSFAYLAAQGAFSSADFGKFLEKGHKGDVIELIGKKMGTRTLLRMGREWVVWQTRQFRQRCARALAGSGRDE